MTSHHFQFEAPLVIGTPDNAGVLPPAGARATAMLHDQRVRGGEVLRADGQDLVINNVLSATAEAQADGSVHIYGRAYGRVSAGMSGNEQARIMCLSFYPEIINIAGHYHAFEEIPDKLVGKPVQVMLHEGTLYAQPMPA